jgi:DNA-directed RNA polymerase subunit RPC12/RpoP
VRFEKLVSHCWFLGVGPRRPTGRNRNSRQAGDRTRLDRGSRAGWRTVEAARRGERGGEAVGRAGRVARTARAGSNVGGCSSGSAVSARRVCVGPRVFGAALELVSRRRRPLGAHAASRLSAWVDPFRWVAGPPRPLAADGAALAAEDARRRAESPGGDVEGAVSPTRTSLLGSHLATPRAKSSSGHESARAVAKATLEHVDVGVWSPRACLQRGAWLACVGSATRPGRRSALERGRGSSRSELAMPHFRCTACGYGCEQPTVIGAGDCPYCGGDVVFDLRRHASPGPCPGPRGRRTRTARRGAGLLRWLRPRSRAA